MRRRTLRHVLAVLVGAAMTAMSTMSPSNAGGVTDPSDLAGPPYEYTTELLGEGVFIPLKDKAMLTRTTHGYLFRTGQQDSHLVLTRVKRGLRFVDRGTARFVKLSGACRERSVKVGVAAVCRVPTDISVRQPLLVEVWPRLGDDFTDGSTLPATIALTVLADGGNDVALLGAGPDFFNGASGRDRVSGGAGDDWIRAGLGNDVVKGRRGDDYLVGVDGRDVVRGGGGDDRVYGMDGNDRLDGGAGADFVVCGAGLDSAKGDGLDVFRDCEAVDRG